VTVGDDVGGPGPQSIPSLAASRAWRDGRLVDAEVTPGEIGATVADPDMLVWIDLLEPTVADLHAVVGSLGLPPTAVEDVLGRFERPKAVQHAGWLYVTTSALMRDATAALPQSASDGDGAGTDRQTAGPSRLIRSRVSAIATSTALVTIRLDARWDMTEVVRRWDEDPDLVGRGVGALLHGLLDVIVDGHFDVIQSLDDDAEDLEDQLLSEGTADDAFILRLYGLRKELVGIRRVVVPMRDVVTGIERHVHASPTAMAPWWGDLYDHVLRAAEWTDSLRDMIAFMVETQMSLMDWRLNIVMKKLAGWAAIIAVPTAITGWFGQNLPFWGYGSGMGLWVSLGLVIASTLLLYWSFRRRDWL
jgi:magnesium transporter